MKVSSDPASEHSTGALPRSKPERRSGRRTPSRALRRGSTIGPPAHGRAGVCAPTESTRGQRLGLRSVRTGVNAQANFTQARAVYSRERERAPPSIHSSEEPRASDGSRAQPGPILTYGGVCRPTRQRNTHVTFTSRVSGPVDSAVNASECYVMAGDVTLQTRRDGGATATASRRTP